MEKFDKALLDTIAELSEHFAMDQLQRWVAAIKRRKLVNTRTLINSLAQDTRADLGRMVVALQFAFEEYGRFQDIKGKRWKEQPPIEDIVAWVKEKGIAAFGPDPNPYRTRAKPESRRINEIAWGIGRQFTKRTRRDKARPWFQSNFYRGLNALYEEISLGVQDRTIESVKESLTDRLKRGPSGKYF